MKIDASLTTSELNEFIASRSTLTNETYEAIKEMVLKTNSQPLLAEMHEAAKEDINDYIDDEGNIEVNEVTIASMVMIYGLELLGLSMATETVVDRELSKRLSESN